MLKSALLLMASLNEPVKPKPANVAHYIDPHWWWNGGEIITFGEPNSVGPNKHRQPDREQAPVK